MKNTTESINSAKSAFRGKEKRISGLVSVHPLNARITAELKLCVVVKTRRRLVNIYKSKEKQ